jgi:hypothetical protein
MVVCSAENLEIFASEVEAQFASCSEYSLAHRMSHSHPSVITRFRVEGFGIEILAQTVSVFVQPAVVRLLVEARLLSFAPAEARTQIRSLKLSGLSTDAAFGEVFDLEPDASDELLKIARLTDRDILMIAHRFHWKS